MSFESLGDGQKYKHSLSTLSIRFVCTLNGQVMHSGFDDYIYNSPLNLYSLWEKVLHHQRYQSSLFKLNLWFLDMPSILLSYTRLFII